MDEPTADGLDQALESAFAMPVGPTTPERIGPYRIHGVLGQGGMGVVYDASEEFPARRVALKVVRPEWTSRELEQRFEREAQLLGRLQHGGIAQVFAAGVLDGATGPQAYIAMERVSGTGFGEWLRDARPTVAQRVEVLARVAEAVQHAHTKGVIHRDLKPANILIEGDGDPKLVDFGIARAIDRGAVETLQTAPGQVLGTIPYMSPEQLGGDPADVDARVDVYALGAVLYEALSGQRPILTDGLPLVQVIQNVQREEPTRLGALDAKLSGDLETIAARALSKEPDHRYSTAAEFAADLRRFLRDEPIVARPATTFYQLRKFARRNRGLTAALGGLMLSLAAGFTGTVAYAVNANEQRAQAEQEAELKRNVNGILTSVLGTSSPFSGGGDTRVVDVLNEVEARLEQELSDDPEVEAALRYALAESYIALSEYATGLEHAERARDLFMELRGPGDPETLAARASVARATIQLGDYEAGAGLAESVWQDSRAALGERARPTLSARADLALAFAMLREDEQALAIAEEVLAARTAEFGELDEDTLRIQMLVGQVHWMMGREQAALEVYQAMVPATIEVHGIDHPRSLYARDGLANLLGSFGHFDEAIEEYSTLLELATDSLGPDHLGTAMMLAGYGGTLSTAGRHGEAAVVLLDSAEAYRKACGDRDTRTLRVVTSYGIALRRLERYDEAEAVILGALEPFGEEVTHPEMAASHAALGNLYKRMERYEEARRHLEIAYEYDLSELGPNHGNVLWGRRNMASLDLVLGKAERAAEALREVWPMRSEALGARHQYTVQDRDLLLEALVAIGTPGAFREAIEVLEVELEEWGGPEDNGPDRWGFRGNLAECHLQLGENEAAIASFEALLADLADAPPSEDIGQRAAEVERRLLELRAG